MLVRIGLDTSEFQKQANEFRRNFRGLGNQLKSVGSSMATGFGAATAAIGGALVYSVKKAADFDQAIKNASIAADDGGKSFDNMRKLALQMGAQTSFSAIDAANGITELLKAGMSADKVFSGGLKGALDLAVIGEMNLADAASFMSDAMNTFSKDGLTAATTANILAGAANKSSANLTDIQYSLAAVGSVANTVGFTLKDTASALAIFANAGLKGSDAGTSLKTMLLNLQPQTKAQIALFKQLGLLTADGTNAFFDEKGKIKNLNAIAGTLNKTFKKMTQQQRLSTMQTLFGTDAIRAASILYESGADGVNKMNTELSNVDAAAQATDKQNTLSGAIEKLSGSFDTAVITIGTVFVPAIQQLAGFLDGLINSFNNLPKPVQDFIAYGAAFVAGLTAIIAVVGGLVWALGALAVAEWAVILPFAGIIAGVTAVIAALIGFGIYLTNLYKTNETFRNVVTAVWEGIKSVIIAVWTTIQPVISAIGTFFVGVFNQIYANTKEVWPAISQLIINTLSVLKPIFEGIISAIKIIWTAAWPYLSQAAIGVLTILAGAIKGSLDIIFGIIKVFIGLLTGNWNMMWNGIKQITDGTLKIVISLFAGLWKIIFPELKLLTDGVMAVFNLILDTIKTFAPSLYNAGANVVSSIIDGIKSKFSAVGQTMSDLAAKIRGYLPFSPAKEGPLSDLNKLDFAGPINDSIKAGIPTVQTSLDSMLSVNQSSAGFNTQTSAASNTTLILNLDGKQISKSVFSNLGGTFRINGAVT